MVIILIVHLIIWFNVNFHADAFRLNDNNYYCSSNRCLEKLTVTQLHLHKTSSKLSSSSSSRSSSSSSRSSRSISLDSIAIPYRRKIQLFKSTTTNTINMINRRRSSSCSRLYMNADININIDDQMKKTMITAFNGSQQQQGLMMSSSSLHAIIGRQVVSLGILDIRVSYIHMYKL